MPEPNQTPNPTRTTDPVTTPDTRPERRIRPDTICPAQKTKVVKTIAPDLPD